MTTVTARPGRPFPHSRGRPATGRGWRGGAAGCGPAAAAGRAEGPRRGREPDGYRLSIAYCASASVNCSPYGDVSCSRICAGDIAIWSW